MMRVALAGFGSSGQNIHAPLLHEAGCEVVAVSTRDAERAAAARAEFPGTRVVPRLDDLLAVPGVDLVVLATPSGAHADAGAGRRRRRLRVPRRQAARRRRRRCRRGRAARRGGRRAADRLPQPALRPRARDGRAGRGRRARRHALPLRDAVGAVAPGAQGPLARERERGRGRRHPARPAQPPRRRSRAAVRAGRRRCSRPSRRARRRRRTTRSSCAATRGRRVAPRGDVAVGRTGPAGAAARHARRHTSWPTSPARPTCGAARPTPTPRTAAGSTAATSASRWSRRDGGQADLYRAVAAALASDDPQAAMPVDPWDAVHTLAVIDAARVSAAEERVVTVETPTRQP